MGRVNVLVVEDEAIVSMDLQNKLESFGYSVSAVIRSGEEAVAAASRLRPDVVLMDIGLSGSMDGIEAAGEIRRRLDIPVVCVTGHGDEYTLKQVSSMNVRYVLKPYDDEGLRLAVEMAIQWRGPKSHRKPPSAGTRPQSLNRELTLQLDESPESSD